MQKKDMIRTRAILLKTGVAALMFVNPLFLVLLCLKKRVCYREGKVRQMHL